MTALRYELARFADREERVTVILRDENDLTRNRKVGSLYSAYEIAVAQAIAGRLWLPCTCFRATSR